MNHAPLSRPALARTTAPRCLTPTIAAPLRRQVRLGLAAAALLLLASGAQAVDFGPFTLTGFAKVESQRTNNACPDCQLYPDALKDEPWSDTLIPGAPYGPRSVTTTLIQPWLGAHFDLGHGVKLAGLLSQRWRDGKPDIPGFVYERNVAVSHEDYGSLRIGAMPTRSWSLGDYPYGTNLGVADAWGASGAGYGLLTGALRYTSRAFDVLDGDLVLEATLDHGNTNFKTNKPSFMEYWAQYRRGDLALDVVFQNTRNGTPSAWGHGPFTGLTPFASDDKLLGGSGQSIAMAMATYQVTSAIEVSGGLRRNRWSGAYAVITNPGPPAQWNNMFNTCWNSDVAACANNPGYAATSTDALLGARWRSGPWTAFTGLVYLGQAATTNPSPRAQSAARNWALINTLGLNYDVGHGVQLYSTVGTVRFGQLGRSPLSMPGNTSFTTIDPRVTQHGNWLTLGAVFVF